WGGLRIKKRGSRVLPVRWKPGRRAVLELDLRAVDANGTERRWRAFARVMPARTLAGRMARWRAAAERVALAAPEIVFVDAERGWFADPVPPGGALATAPAPALRAALSGALATLHAAPAPG